MPAKTVTRLPGFLSALARAIFRAGRALAAAQPHTEFTATSTVPSFVGQRGINFFGGHQLLETDFGKVLADGGHHVFGINCHCRK